MGANTNSNTRSLTQVSDSNNVSGINMFNGALENAFDQQIDEINAGENIIFQNLEAQEDLPDVWNVHMQDGSIVHVNEGEQLPNSGTMGFAAPGVDYIQYGAGPVPPEHSFALNGELTFHTPLDEFIGTSWKFYPMKRRTAQILQTEREEGSTGSFECTHIMPGFDSCMWMNTDVQVDLPNTFNAHWKDGTITHVTENDVSTYDSAMGFAGYVEYWTYGDGHADSEHSFVVKGKMTFNLPIDEFNGTSYKFTPMNMTSTTMDFKKREEGSNGSYDCVPWDGDTDCFWLDPMMKYGFN